MRSIVFLLLLVFTLVCCSSKNDVPRGIIPPDKMQLIIFDLLKADEFVNSFVIKDTSLNRNAEVMKLYQQVFTVHQVERDEFYKSYQYYQAHPDKSKMLIDSLTARQTRLQNPPPTPTLKKDSVLQKPVIQHE